MNSTEAKERNKIAILLCTYNGHQFLHQQLRSFSTLTVSNWKLFVYDDRSTDNTCDIIEQYKSSIPQEVVLTINPSQQGFSKNFLSAICQTPNDSDFFALSDQDDIWQKDKLTLALEYLKKVPEHIPALYCSRTQLIDEQANTIGFSSLFRKPPAFKNALVQSIAGGNTMVFNKAAKELISSVGQNINIVSHDWWIYLLITGIGGHVFYDPISTVLYRQHNANLIGTNTTLIAKLTRLKKVMRGQLRLWISKNISALETCRALLSHENTTLLDKFIKMRNSNLFTRMHLFFSIKIYRQSFFQSIALFLLVCSNKI